MRTAVFAILLVALSTAPATAKRKCVKPPGPIDWSCGRCVEDAPPSPYGGANSPWSMTPAYRFEEKGYLRCNPDAAAEIRAGKYKSAVEHYCAHYRTQSRVSMCSPSYRFDPSNPYQDPFAEPAKPEPVSSTDI